MEDRFKFKAVLHQNKYEEYQLEEFSHQKVFDVMSINLGIEYSTIEIIAEYPNGDWAVREIDDKDIDLIQCTGLKDKNGKLIYEGDIIKFQHGNQKRVGRVEVYKTEWLVSNSNFCQGAWCGGVLINLYETCEVIGNIYETPELLTKEKVGQ